MSETAEKARLDDSESHEGIQEIMTWQIQGGSEISGGFSFFCHWRVTLVPFKPIEERPS